MDRQQGDAEDLCCYGSAHRLVGMDGLMNYQSTKFLQTTLVIVLGTGLLLHGDIEGTGYITLMLGALANYAYHDVKQKGVK